MTTVCIRPGFDSLFINGYMVSKYRDIYVFSRWFPTYNENYDI